MKKFLIFLFSIIVSFNSYGEWTKITKGVDGDYFYIDLDTIKENDGDVYWWGMADFHLSYKPYNSYYQWDKGVVSEKTYFQGDCGIVRLKVLSRTFYQHGMVEGKGIPDKYASSSDWTYPSPETIGKDLLDFVCDSLK